MCAVFPGRPGLVVGFFGGLNLDAGKERFALLGGSAHLNSAPLSASGQPGRVKFAGVTDPDENFGGCLGKELARA